MPRLPLPPRSRLSAEAAASLIPLQRARQGDPSATPCQGDPQMWDDTIDGETETRTERSFRHLAAAQLCRGACRIFRACLAFARTNEQLPRQEQVHGVLAGRVISDPRTTAHLP